jgi:ABC-type polysaccharide/polyol phosphate export permease
MNINFKYFKNIRLPFVWGANDIKQRYRRSIIGPFWITITNLIFIVCLSLIYHKLFNIDFNFFILWLATGIIPWYLVSSQVNDGMICVIEAENIVKSIPINLNTIFLRVTLRNFLIFFHNVIIIIILSLFFKANIFFLLFTFPLIILIYSSILFPVCGILAIFATRYRDIISMVNSLIQLIFLISPIIWHPSLLNTGRLNYIIELNPIYHFLEIFRSPILYGKFPINSYIFIFIVSLFLNMIFIYFYKKKKVKVVFWI